MLSNEQRAHDLAIASIQVELQEQHNEKLNYLLASTMENQRIKRVNFPEKIDFFSLYRERYDEYLKLLSEN